jgi:mevalonate kinase
MEKTVVSAPGKIILAGEHAVVYGQPAIVAAIDRRLTVTVKPGRLKKKYSGLVKFALAQILKPGETVDLTIESELPANSGLGSSAALATALVWALLPQASLEAKNRLVKVIEDHQHGQSSGVDQTIVREGGFLKFQQGKFQPVDLPIKQAILIDSGRPQETTGDMVKAVAQGNFSQEFAQIGRLVNRWQPELIKENERLLEAIGVVGSRAKKMIRQIEASGGAAKICGAGGVKTGSGMLLAVHPDETKLRRLIANSRWHYLRVNLGAPGVRYEGN